MATIIGVGRVRGRATLDSANTDVLPRIPAAGCPPWCAADCEGERHARTTFETVAEHDAVRCDQVRARVFVDRYDDLGETNPVGDTRIVVNLASDPEPTGPPTAQDVENLTAGLDSWSLRCYAATLLSGEFEHGVTLTPAEAL